MYLRAENKTDQLVNGRPVLEYGKANLYPTAFPFDRCNAGSPGTIAFVALTGSNPTVTTAADLWPQNTVRTLPTAAFTIGLSSSNANDTSAGTGARTVEIDYLDANYVPYTVTMTLNGQTKVSGATAFRINDIRIKTWGSTLANVGDIYVYDASDTVTAGVPQTASKIFHKIVAGENVARGGFYTVPAGCQLQTQQYRAGIYEATTPADKAVALKIGYLSNTSSGLAKSEFPIPSQVSNLHPYVSITPDFPAILDEKTDIRLQASASSSSAVVAVLDCVLFYK